MKNKESKLITENQQVLKRWRECFCELLNVDEQDDVTSPNNVICCHVRPKVESPTKELNGAVKALQSNNLSKIIVIQKKREKCNIRNTRPLEEFKYLGDNNTK